MEIVRNKYLNMLVMRMHNRLVKVITGIRRCGKSYLLNTIFYNYLINNGVSKDHIIRFAFDSAKDLELIDEDLEMLTKTNQKVNAKKFLSYIRKKTDGQGMYYLLLDEVQNLSSFEAVLNGYLREDNLDIYVTGSNSKFLSKDVITEFAGRGDEIHMLPLSFSEFYASSNKDINEAIDEYILYGGLPMVALMNDDEQKTIYLKTQLTNVYLRDIILKNHLTNDKNIDELLDVTASGMSSLTNPNELSNTFKSEKHEQISAITIDNYLNYLEDAFVISKVKRYDVQGKRYINTPYKIYFEDIGLRNAKLNFRQLDKGNSMENIIYNELRYRGYNVDIGVIDTRKTVNGVSKRKQFEIDFIANLGSKRYYIQSVYDLHSEEKLTQEMQSLDNVNDSFKKIIVVRKNSIPRRTEKGYLIISLKECLMNPNSLEI